MNSILKNSKISILLLAICFSLTACDEDDDFMTSDDVMETPDPTDDVVESYRRYYIMEKKGFCNSVANMLPIFDAICERCILLDVWYFFLILLY